MRRLIGSRQTFETVQYCTVSCTLWYTAANPTSSLVIGLLDKVWFNIAKRVCFECDTVQFTLKGVNVKKCIWMGMTVFGEENCRFCSHKSRFTAPLSRCRRSKLETIKIDDLPPQMTILSITVFQEWAIMKHLGGYVPFFKYSQVLNTWSECQASYTPVSVYITKLFTWRFGFPYIKDVFRTLELCCTEQDYLWIQL